jgi:acyl-CoA oxidase
MQASLEEQVNVVMLCCGIKPMCGWNCERTASTCRERCGGQGYLSCNRFGTIIGFAHATVTAEGDNRVLMQKVAKELLGVASSGATRRRLQAAEAEPKPVRCISLLPEPSLQCL